MQMDTSPDPRRIFLSLAARKLTWKAALAEIIDNSANAGATRIEVVYSRPYLSVRDNGHGAAPPRIEKMLTYGGHLDSPSNLIGRHGVGLKDAAAWIGSPIEIKTVCEGAYMCVTRDWYRDSDATFEVLDPKPATAEVRARIGISGTDKGGTLIRVKLKPGRRFPSKAEFERLVDELGFLYTPRLRKGLQLSLRSGKTERLAQVYALPSRSEVIEKTVYVTTRKSLKINVGVVDAEHENPRPGIAYYYGTRVIQHGSMGCGMYGTRNIAGTVELIGDWKLSAHKDDLCEDAQAASDAVFATIHDLLERASARGAQLSLSGLCTDLSRELTDAFTSGGVGAKRPGRGASSGSGGGDAPPAGEGGAGAGRGGKGVRRRRGGGVTGRVPRMVAVEFIDRDDGRVAEVKWADDDSVRVYLALNHPYIARWTQGGGEADRAILKAICGSALADYISHEPDGAQRRLPGMGDQLDHDAYGTILWRLLASDAPDAGAEEAAL